MRKIAVFTGTRAEYGLLYWIIKGLHQSSKVELQLIVGGMHLSPEFGFTIDQIVKDGFPIAEKMEMMLSSDSAVGTAKAMGLATISAAETFERHRPDLLVLLGDRFEALAVAQAAMVSCLPIAHIHGGETTEGVIDEAVRHSLTKMSHLHLVATEEYRHRVIQLGENPSRVVNFGAPGIDNIVKLDLAERDQLSQLIDFDLDRSPFFLVTYHPVTLEPEGASIALEGMLRALDHFPDHKLLITYSNADANGRLLIDTIEKYKVANPDRVFLTHSLGQYRYLSLMKHCSAVVGNSSSGLIEAPTLKVPTVNIGNRQKGRMCGETVIQCADGEGEILSAIRTALSESFLDSCKFAINPYGDGRASEKIVDKLITVDLDNIIKKSFFDVKFEF